jgi:hypothetical protein
MTAQHRDEDTAAVTMSLLDQFFAPIEMQMLEWLQLAPGAQSWTSGAALV